MTLWFVARSKSTENKELAYWDFLNGQKKKFYHGSKSRCGFTGPSSTHVSGGQDDEMSVPDLQSMAPPVRAGAHSIRVSGVMHKLRRWTLHAAWI